MFDKKALLLMRVSVIMLMAIMFNNNIIAQQMSVTAAPLTALPLWDIAVTNESELCHLEQRSSSHVLIHGSANTMCSLQINTSIGYDARIEIPGIRVSKQHASLYVERQGDLAKCTNRYVAINRNDEVCNAVVLQNIFQLHLRGNVSISVRVTSALELQPECPETYAIPIPSPSPQENQTAACKGIKGYVNQITCDLDNNDGMCRLNFPTSCNAIIRYREALLQCLLNEELHTQEWLITYPVETVKLDLGNNRLTQIDVDLFTGLAHLTYLSISNNRLPELPVGLFRGLTNLLELWLNHNELITLPNSLFWPMGNLSILSLQYNQLISLDEDIFNGLAYLTSLRLYGNYLTTLPSTLFRGLGQLEKLYLLRNQLATLDESVFNGLISLKWLYLGENKFTTLPNCLFKGLPLLQKLDVLSLNRNQLATLNESIFDELTSLSYLELHNNILISLPIHVFRGLINLEKLYLRENQLVTLNESVFNPLVGLIYLTLGSNKLNSLPSNVFNKLTSLTRLWLNDNKLQILNESIFNELRSLNQLVLYDNKLTSLPGGLFLELGNLIELYFYGNNIVKLNSNMFHNLNNLRTIDIYENKLASLPHDVFHNLSHLEHLFLYDNHLKWLNAGLLKGLRSLDILNVSSNLLAHIDFDIFKDTVSMTYLDLSNNRLKECPNIKHLIQLESLILRDNILTGINQDTFSSLAENAQLAVSQHEICECYVPAKVNCSASDKRSPYLTCERLLSDKVLVVLMWLIGINALVGNMFVLVWRQVYTKKYKVQDILLSNLAMSDSLMGFYMLIVASADINYGEHFPMQSETWRTGIVCRIAGALSIASTELSIFFLVLISVDRFIGIKYPYSNKMGKRSTIMTSVLVWTISLALGVVPSILAGTNFKFYDNSHVCIGLPLALTKTYRTDKYFQKVEIENLYFYTDTFTTQFTGFVNGLYYSSALFLGLNSLCYLIILVCYIEIVRAVAKSAKQTGRTPGMDEQIRLTRKVSAIVLTDFMCIFPIILLGILVQTRVIELPASVYAWSVTFVLPINSAINPYLYTSAEIISKYRKKKAGRDEVNTVKLQTM